MIHPQGPIAVRIATRRTLGPDVAPNVAEAFATIRSFSALYHGMGNFANHQARVSAALQLLSVDTGETVNAPHILTCALRVTDHINPACNALTKRKAELVDAGTSAHKANLSELRTKIAEIDKKIEELDAAREALYDQETEIEDIVSALVESNRAANKAELQVLDAQLKGMDEQRDEVMNVKNLLQIMK